MTAHVKRLPPHHRHRPMVLGLTGSIGMGKSAVAKMLRAEGVPVFDADAEVHKLQGPGGALLPAIEAAFPGTTGPQGVDRAKLGAAVFGNPAALKTLEHIVHPAVGRSRAAFVRAHRARRIIVFDIPLLFEKGGTQNVDGIIVVSAALWQQRKRVMARPGMTAARLRHIRHLQMADHHKRCHADWIIPTGRTKLATRQAVRKLLRKLRPILAH
ncbi:dephospho-CoA kinase [Blastomonas sp.]|uniref:dephospho-CoA kinase n=1 Tax=Blastomonas sp. TaxID=1909299 RepID=UPI00391C42E8